jgi:flavin-dependent dehydrogenase
MKKSERKHLMEKYDIVIIGASIAGASILNYLKNTDLKVCIIDKHAFPRATDFVIGMGNIAGKVDIRKDFDSLLEKICVNTSNKILGAFLPSGI